ncbi:hypothetical protein SCE1572_41795 [Sorangium cellulosum So0157-2]|uniref:Uncharacterized protein n=1 Tax=Sorangium cellulosum So0157-2 TaxID=1254432 RepID=S4Y8C2_SORCE|nr:hypothetical protein SCE1572_41795 [Sorangium cellulosum So0157-2]
MVKERDVALRQAHTKVTLLRAYVQSVASMRRADAGGHLRKRRLTA